MKFNKGATGALIARQWAQLRAHEFVTWMLASKFAWLLTALVLSSLVVFFSATQHLRIEARTESVEIEFLPGRPIAWPVGGARVLDCRLLVDQAEYGAASGGQQAQLGDAAEIVISAIEDTDTKSLSTVRAKVSLDADDVVVEIKRLNRRGDGAETPTADCAKDGRVTAVLDTGDGKQHAISLPAQFRLDVASIGDALTLEVRGNLRIGNDVTSGRQSLLMSGWLTLRQVRRPWLQSMANAQFDIESRDLGLGDKVTIAAPSARHVKHTAPQGFVRIVKGDRGPEMSVHATAFAGWARIVHPFSPPETPRANLFKRVWADQLLSTLIAFFFTLLALYFGYLQIEASKRSKEC